MAYDISSAFERIEDELIHSMIRNLKHHQAEEAAEGFEWEQWQVAQLKELQRFKQQHAKKYGTQFHSMNKRLRDAIAEAHQQGMSDEEQTILEAIKNGYQLHSYNPGMTASFFRTNERKLQALMNAVEHDMKTAQTAVLRYADDQYRRIIYDAQVAANTGAMTYEKAVDMATQDFLGKGINCIQYSNGAMVNIASYAEMAIRTANKRAYLMGEGVKRQEWGITTVILNKRTNACPLCMPFEGKVLIDDVWSGGKASDGDYPLMSSAMAAGLYHPNCKDKHTTYFEGVSTPPERIFTRQELDDVIERQRLENKADYATRQVKRFERLQQYSLDEGNKDKYGRKVEEWKQKSENLMSALQAFEDAHYQLDDSFESDFKRFKRRQKFPKIDNEDVTLQHYNSTLKQYQEKTRQDFQNGTVLGKRILMKYADLTSIASLSANRVRYENGQLFLNMFEAMFDERGVSTSYFHELGHHIDDKLGWKFMKDNKILEFLYEDYNELDLSKVENLITTDAVASAVSDIVGFLSLGLIRGRFGHRDGYWNSKGKMNSEFFAHFFEAQFNDKRRKILELHFPKTYNYIVKCLERV